MAMDADRRREVARLLRMLAPHIDGETLPGCYLAAMDAAELLEEMGEAPRCSCVPLPPPSFSYSTDCPRHGVSAPKPSAASDLAPDERAAYGRVVDGLFKPSATSMEERIRALEGEIGIMHRLSRGAVHNLTAMEGLLLALEQIERRANRALHPHASWCRDLSHEGPCIPEDQGRDE